MTIIKLAIVLLLAPALTVPAEGATGSPLSIPDLAARADLVVLGQVLAVRSEWNHARTTIVTRISLKIDELLKGTAPGDDVSFYQLGGRVGDVESVVAGTPVFTEHERVLVFLSAERDGHRRIVELFQGKFSIERDSGSGREVAVRRVPGLARPELQVPLEQARQLIRAR